MNKSTHVYAENAVSGAKSINRNFPVNQFTSSMILGNGENYEGKSFRRSKPGHLVGNYRFMLIVRASSRGAIFLEIIAD